jgi:FtsZ-binding cell division protein ZapB
MAVELFTDTRAGLDQYVQQRLRDINAQRDISKLQLDKSWCEHTCATGHLGKCKQQYRSGKNGWGAHVDNSDYHVCCPNFVFDGVAAGCDYWCYVYSKYRDTLEPDTAYTKTVVKWSQSKVGIAYIQKHPDCPLVIAYRTKQKLLASSKKPKLLKSVLPLEAPVRLSLPAAPSSNERPASCTFQQLEQKIERLEAIIEAHAEIERVYLAEVENWNEERKSLVQEAEDLQEEVEKLVHEREHYKWQAYQLSEQLKQLLPSTDDTTDEIDKRMEGFGRVNSDDTDVVGAIEEKMADIVGELQQQLADHEGVEEEEEEEEEEEGDEEVAPPPTKKQRTRTSTQLYSNSASGYKGINYDKVKGVRCKIRYTNGKLRTKYTQYDRNDEEDKKKKTEEAYELRKKLNDKFATKKEMDEYCRLNNIEL